jgi:sodium/proline symporter
MLNGAGLQRRVKSGRDPSRSVWNRPPADPKLAAPRPIRQHESANRRESHVDPEPARLAFTFAVYFAVVWMIGWYAYRRTRDLSDFILGGRTLGSGVAALSASASDMSGWLLLGLPGFAYAAGLESVWLAAGLLLGTWANWRLVAATTAGLQHRPTAAPDPPGVFRQPLRGPGRMAARHRRLVHPAVLSSLYQRRIGGRGQALPIGLRASLRLGRGARCLSIMIYTAVGGFLAVSWTDVLQGC